MKKILLLISYCLIVAAASYSQIEKPITKGNKYIVGNLGFNYSNVESSKDYGDHSSLTLDFNPGLGYFVLNNLSIGLSLNALYDKNSSTATSRVYAPYSPTMPPSFIAGVIAAEKEVRNYSLGLNPFAKFYIKSGFFIGAGLYYSYNSTTLTNNYAGTSISYVDHPIDNIYDESPNYNSSLPSINQVYIPESDILEIKKESTSIAYSLSAGYTFFISKKVGLETAVKYYSEIAEFARKTNFDETEPQYPNINYINENKEDEKSNHLLFSIGLIVFM